MPSSNKVVIVTGGGTGVGRATSLAMARMGYDVIVNYSRSKDDAIATANEIMALGMRVFAFQVLDHAGIGERRGIAQRAEVVRRDLAQDAAHDLAGARLGQARGPLDEVG